MIGDLELELSVAIFKQGQDLQNSLITLFDQIQSRFDSIEPDIRTLAGFDLPSLMQCSLVDDQNVIREKAQQEIDEDFLRWLSPSNWEVQAQLEEIQNQRKENTLDWVREMPEFQQWQDSVGRVLWIRGSAGVGKSVIAGFLINHLQVSYPSSVVGYFFCKSGESKLMDIRSIIRTIAYHCMEKCTGVRIALRALKKTQFSITLSVEIRLLFKQLLMESLL